MTIALFDLDNTLIDRQGTLTAWANAFARSRGLDAPTEEHLVDALRDRAYPATFEALRQELPLAEPTEMLWADYVQGMAAGVTQRPDVIDGVKQLRVAGWVVGILTNGAGDIQRAKIKAAGLADVVDAVAISEEIGARKPDPKAFQSALALCGTDRPGEAWMVGDNPEGDIAGAHQAGLRTIWVRGRPWPRHLPAAHHSVDSVADAIHILMIEGSL
ncbi:HAD family hydrolase [Streptomyces sp. M-16]|uniref:HAD family hydrolase n=1 Tax=Streptomyces sp. M-16 TaxID=3233040 RepID=UPI003F9BE7B3